MKKNQTYQPPTVRVLTLTAEEVLGDSNTNPPELPDHDWVSFQLPKVDLEEK